MSKRLLTFFLLANIRNPLFSLQSAGSPDINDPHLFHDDVAAAQEEDGVVVEDFYEAATDIEDMGSIRAESNEGVAEHAIGDASFLCFPSCLWGRHIAVLVCIPALESIGRHARFYCGACLHSGGGITGGGGGGSTGHSTAICGVICPTDFSSYFVTQACCPSHRHIALPATSSAQPLALIRFHCSSQLPLNIT